MKLSLFERTLVDWMKVSILFMVVGIMSTGCVWTTQQATVMTLDTAVVMNSYDSVKSSIKALTKRGKFNQREIETISRAENIFNDVYNDLMDPTIPVTYVQLYEASLEIVNTYEAVKAVILVHWDEFAAIDQARMKNFDKRLTRIYEALEAARKDKDTQAVMEATESYLEVFGTIAKIGIATML